MVSHGNFRAKKLSSFVARAGCRARAMTVREAEVGLVAEFRITFIKFLTVPGSDWHFGDAVHRFGVGLQLVL